MLKHLSRKVSILGTNKQNSLNAKINEAKAPKATS